MTFAELWQRCQKILFEPGSPIPLCLFRIVYGLVLLEYCILLAPEVITCFSDTNGILRISTLQNIFGVPVINLITNLPPGDNWLIAFFSVFVVSCICVTLGLFTKWSMIFVYLGLVSLQHRNIYVMHSGDHLLSLAAFYMLFAPVDAALSLDRIRRIWFSSQMPSPVAENKSLWALRAYQFQFILIYWQTSWAKLASPMWFDGTAMYYVLRYTEFLRFPLPFVANNIILIKLLTWGALFIEFFAWVFIWFKETRYLVLLALLALHLGIDYTMNIPVFEHIMIASLIIFIPAEDLSRVMDLIKSKVAVLFGPPLILAYHASVDFENKFARTVRSLDVLGLVRTVNLEEEELEIPVDVPRSAREKLMVRLSNTWLYGMDVFKPLSGKLPLLWFAYPVFLLFS